MYSVMAFHIMQQNLLVVIKHWPYALNQIHSGSLNGKIVLSLLP